MEGKIRFPPVLTKKDFVTRYQKGEFGNRVPTWNSLEEVLSLNLLENPGKDDLYHIRNRIAGAETWYKVPPGYLERVWKVAASKVGKENLYISQMIPDSLEKQLLIQGEVFVNERGLNLFYSRVIGPMRDSLKKGGRQVEGIEAKTYLDFYLESNSREWLDVLLERYPSHVIEFSTFSKRFGTLNESTIFWEVRNY